jgi:serine/threonine protein phosphatase 1
MAPTPMRAWLRGLGKTAPRYPALPSSVTVYAIGDVHGRLDCLERAQASIERDRWLLHRSQRAVEVYLGDYVDRGPQTAGVIENLIARAGQTEVIALRGNHEMLMMAFLRGSLSFTQWRGLGGRETAMSYGVSAQRLQKDGSLSPADLAPLVPPAHFAFLSTLRPYFTLGGYCFVHAGLRPGIPLARQSAQDLAWIREDFLNHGGSFENIVVHGHTPVAEIEFHRHRINVDTGAYLSNKLSVLRIDAYGPAILRG